ncbi:hypothetical protein JAAARDRAFT_202331 [Jaapia argillacea MUCL 33604]|uniref:Uncharacterized protein n=1 Tax=Jaapia argillacea MUCL 33604 TaxID=933084 RepID=A0A067QQY5_9AGAM|nr:hypothetical protein JAAARDRAFT_202331 [Jaapia argillacea MUCL 33604]
MDPTATPVPLEDPRPFVADAPILITMAVVLGITFIAVMSLVVGHYRSRILRAPPPRQLLLPTLIHNTSPVNLSVVGALSATCTLVAGAIPRFTALPKAFNIHQVFRRSMEMVCRGSLWDFDAFHQEGKNAGQEKHRNPDSIDLELAYGLQAPSPARLSNIAITPIFVVASHLAMVSPTASASTMTGSFTSLENFPLIPFVGPRPLQAALSRGLANPLRLPSFDKSRYPVNCSLPSRTASVLGSVIVQANRDSKPPLGQLVVGEENVRVFWMEMN